MIRFSGVSKEYPTKAGPVKALQGIDLHVRRGEFLCIAGPSGSGKSTLLNLAGGLDRPTEGRVVVHSVDVGRLDRSAASRFRLHHIGFIFQSFNLLPVLTASENVEYVLMIQGVEAAERGRRVERALEQVGLGHKGSMRADQLSGGEQQRVAAARAMVSEPPIILADEPTANLDSRSGERLIETLHRLNRTKGTTMVFSSHDPAIIARADRVITLRDGRIEG